MLPIKSLISLRFKLLFLLSFILFSCGFTLDGANDFYKINQVSLEVNNASLKRNLNQNLRGENITVQNKISNDILHLKVQEQGVDERTLSLYSSGYIAEFELIYRVSVSVFIKDRVFRKDFFRRRNYRDDPNFALAKSREKNLLIDEMRVVISKDIVNFLAKLQSEF